MPKRSINQILQTGFCRCLGLVCKEEQCQIMDALRDAQDVLERARTLDNAMHMSDVRCSAQAILKKWDNHD